MSAFYVVIGGGLVMIGVFSLCFVVAWKELRSGSVKQLTADNHNEIITRLDAIEEEQTKFAHKTDVERVESKIDSIAARSASTVMLVNRNQSDLSKVKSKILESEAE